MINSLQKIFLLLTLALGTGLASFGQFGAWQYQVPVSTVNTTGINQTDYQIRMIYNTAALVTAGKMLSSGDDIRFGTACDTYDYWIEAHMNTDTTIIWVKVPAVDTVTPTNFFMFYGNSAASAASNWAATFPNAIITSGNINLTSGGAYDWLEISSGDTAFLQSGVLNVISPRYVIVDGYVMGEGLGNQAPGTSNTGTGPGGGNFGTSSGAGGGSYGGLGGVGGYDSADPIIQPGAVYGTTTGNDIDMGSSGGSASTVIGGDGGGGLFLSAGHIEINGVINCNGGLAQQPGGGQGAGGGSGGGIMVLGEDVVFTGSMTANGNGGSIGTSTANDDGGGGGGGRIKIRYENNLANTGSFSVNGGSGGINGGVGTGAPGNAGTTHTTTGTLPDVSGNPGVEAPQTAGNEVGPTVSGPTGACAGDTLNLLASGGFSNYDYYVNGVLVQSGTDSTFSTTVTSSVTISWAIQGSCVYSDSVFIPVSTPATSISINGPTVCEGDTVQLNLAGTFTSQMWSNGGTGTSILVTSQGDYSVMVTDSNGCTASDTVNVPFLSTPSPVLVLNPAGSSFCEGDTIIVSATNTWPSYNWSTGDTTPTIAVSATATVSLMVADTSSGCMGSDTVTITVNPNPVPSISNAGGTLSTTQTYASYQWLSNGSAVSGETSQTYTPGSSGTYSVTVVDANGCTGTSDTTFVFVGLDPARELSSVKVYPNPFNSKVQLDAYLPASGSVKIQIADLTGRIWTVMEEEATGGDWNREINLSDLPAGIYLLRLETVAGYATLRLMKE